MMEAILTLAILFILFLFACVLADCLIAYYARQRIKKHYIRQQSELYDDFEEAFEDMIRLAGQNRNANRKHK